MELSHPDNRDRADALFAMLEAALSAGTRFAPVSEVDAHVAARAGVVFLKHDIHDVNLDRLVAFAEREISLGIRGSYFFMSPNHPRTRSAYDFAAQSQATRAISALGHEIGLHIDPYFQIHETQKRLDNVLRDLRAAFGTEGIDLRIGNTHGNSAHKHLDLDGYGTSFDLFAEIGRQPDFPALSRVPTESAERIRANRVSLLDHGFTHWGDLPLWSKNLGFVATNYLTDNNLGKRGTYTLLVATETQGCYLVSDRQPPGADNRPTDGKKLTISECEHAQPHPPGRTQIDFGGSELSQIFENPVPVVPLSLLLHPEFYC